MESQHRASWSNPGKVWLPVKYYYLVTCQKTCDPLQQENQLPFIKFKRSLPARKKDKISEADKLK